VPKYGHKNIEIIKRHMADFKINNESKITILIYYLAIVNAFVIN